MSDLERVEYAINWLIFFKKVKNRRELAKVLEYTESSLSQILNKKVPLSDNFIKKLSTVFNEINEHWLLTGEGEMLKTNPQQSKNRFELDTAERLLIIVESQQRTIENLSETIKNLTNK